MIEVEKWLPFEKALGISLVTDRTPIEIENESPTESEPELAEKGNGKEAAQSMAPQ